MNGDMLFKRKDILIVTILTLVVGVPVASSIGYTAYDGYFVNVDTFADTTYVEMWNYSANATAYLFPIAVQGIYYNITGLTLGESNGDFTFTDNPQASGGSYITIKSPGVYKINIAMSFESDLQGSLYGIGLGKNFNIGMKRGCYMRRSGIKNSVGNVGTSCIESFATGDIINILFENELNDRDVLIHTVNINLVRIG